MNSPRQTIVGKCFHRDFVPILLGCRLMPQHRVQNCRGHRQRCQRSTVTRSPMMRLMGNRPQSTCGRTFSMTTLRALAGLMELFPAPVIGGADLPALSSRPLVKDRRGGSRTRRHEKTAMIWPVFQIYHMRWRIARYRYTLLARVTQMRQRVEMTTSTDVDRCLKSCQLHVS